MRFLRSQKIILSIIIFFSGSLMLFYQNLDFAPTGVDCKANVNIPVLGWDKFPKLFFDKNSLGRAVACARPDLRDELVRSAAQMYLRIKDVNIEERQAVKNIGVSADNFHTQAIGGPVRVPGTYTQYSPTVNFNFPGDARLVQRLSAAAYFVDSETAVRYRNIVRRILLSWATHTFTPNSIAEAQEQALTDGNFGLSVGSSMTGFAFGYDLLAAGRGIPLPSERRTIEDWFRRTVRLIVVSNDNWMKDCVNNVEFAYDGQSCERAMGDNHVTVATTGIYALAIMSGRTSLAKRAIENTLFPQKWGYNDRLGTIIYSVGESVARQDRFPYVHTGEIYDRWRGHYVERVRQLQLHRSMSYPYLSLAFLTAQALMAKRQGEDLLQPVVKKNGQSISLEKAFLFYSLFLTAYNPGEVIDPNTPRLGEGSDVLPGLKSIVNYTSLANTYCVNGFQPDPTDASCVAAAAKGLLYDSNSVAYTEGYYHTIFAGADYLLRGAQVSTRAAMAKVITPEKMKFSENSFSSHNMPFEPALLIEQ